MPPQFPCTIWPSFSTANHTIPAPAPKLINQVTSTARAQRSSVTEKQSHNREAVGGQGMINVEATMSSSLRGEVYGDHELLHSGGRAAFSLIVSTPPHLHNVIQPLVHHTRERENGYE